MKSIIKRRMAVLLSILMVLPTILSFLPGQATEVEAATNAEMYFAYATSCINEQGKDSQMFVEIENGQSFVAGDVTYYYTQKANGLVSELGSSVKYTTSDKNVVSVSKTGQIKALKEGDAKVTLKYKGAKAYINVKVTPKNSHDISAVSNMQKRNQTLKNLTKIFSGSSVKESDIIKMRDLDTKYQDACRWTDADMYINSYGFIRPSDVKEGDFYYLYDTKGIEISNNVNKAKSDYRSKYSPISTSSAKKLNLTKVVLNKGKNTGTVTFDNKVSKQAMISLQLYDEGAVQKSYCTYLPVYAGKDSKGEEIWYVAEILLTQGKNTAKITETYRWIYDKETNFSYKSAIKYEAGKKYTIGKKTKGLEYYGNGFKAIVK